MTSHTTADRRQWKLDQQRWKLEQQRGRQAMAKEQAEFRLKAAQAGQGMQLSGAKTAMQLRLDWMKGIADYKMKMMEILGKRVKIEQDLEQLRMLRKARIEYAAALKEIKREWRRVDKLGQRLEKHIKNALRLSMGEIINPDLLSRSWGGLIGLMRNYRISVPVLKKHRAAMNWFRPRTPLTDCVEAKLAESRSDLALFIWAKKKAYIPISGSATDLLIEKILDEVDKRGRQDAVSLSSKIQAIQKQLLELRQGNWKAQKVIE